VYTTDAEEPPPRLEPWVQWATVHSGLPFAAHGAFHLGDGRKIREKCLATVLSDAGVRVGVFGSMNTNYTALNGYFIPDPWDLDGRPQPHWLRPFFDTVSQQVQNSSKAGGLSKMQLARFGAFMVRHGLRKSTIASIIRQLLSERADLAVAWRRASLLELIQYDLFRYLDRRFQPQFSTFFCNSTAHYQHYYWRNMHPKIFVVPPEGDAHPSLQTAIEYGYQQMDGLVGQFMKDYPNTTLILCTALSQQPWTETTKCTYRPVDFSTLLRVAGLTAETIMVKPVMAEEFHLVFASASAARQGQEALASLKVNEKPLLRLENRGHTLFGGCAITDPLAMRAHIVGFDGQPHQFSDMFHMVHSMRSGRHHPDGVLWIRDGRHQQVLAKASLVDIAPTILERFNVPLPSHMKGSPLRAGHQVAELICSA
jgi:hypothetical protein